MIILAIETSCDETAIAIIDYKKKTKKVKILANLVSSQIEIHKPFGGVVPNLARREHEKNLVPILIEALKKAGLLNMGKSDVLKQKTKYLGHRTSGTKEVELPKIEEILERENELREIFIKEILPLTPPKIDAIAVTHGPGLAPALWVGVNFARALAYIWKKPLTPVNHMEGHIISALLPQSRNDNVKFQISNFKTKTNKLKLKIKNLKLPAMALLVSGGHTELVLIKKLGKYHIVGETVDDAAGECFDKVARILDLPYPGGPEISKLALKATDYRLPAKLPRPMIQSKDFNFSFSGLKTAVLYLTRDLKDSYLRPEVKTAIAKEFQNAVVEVLVTKTIRAAKTLKVKTIILGGGVAANKKLREDLLHAVNSQLSRQRRGSPKAANVSCLLPNISATGDNALMIALAAALSDKKKDPKKIEVKANLRLS